jgi:hypothetical protein
MDTPRLTAHARARCAEMGVPTKVAKRIVQHADIVRPGNRGTGCLVSVSDDYPDYIVVHTDPADGPVEIVTVSFRTGGTYIRDGATYIPIDEEP